MKRTRILFDEDRWKINVERNLRKLREEPPTPLPKNLKELLKFKPFWLIASGVCMVGVLVGAIAYNLSSYGSVRAQTKLPSGHTVSVVRNDITQENVDAIVNAANNRLHHGGGIAGAIVKNGGLVIQRESDAIVKAKGPIPTGEAVVTGGGQLPAKYVIHAVGPIWRGGSFDEDVKLKHAVWNSLERARELKVNSIAIPAISSGIFGFPKDRCAFIVVDTVTDFASKHPNEPPLEIRLTNVDEASVWEFTKEFDRTFPGSRV